MPLLHRDVNSWEMEDILESLATAVSSSHKTTLTSESEVGFKVELPGRKPTSTIFVLNLDLLSGTHLSEGEYSYRSGFSPYDLQTLAESGELRELASEALKDAKRSARVTDPHVDRALGDAVQFAIKEDFSSFSEANISQSRDGRGESGGASAAASSSVHWLDAVKETRAWAKTFTEETDALKEVTNVAYDNLSVTTARPSNADGTSDAL
jgi:hypothetical protein